MVEALQQLLSIAQVQRISRSCRTSPGAFDKRHVPFRRKSLLLPWPRFWRMPVDVNELFRPLIGNALSRIQERIDPRQRCCSRSKARRQTHSQLMDLAVESGANSTMASRGQDKSSKTRCDWATCLSRVWAFFFLSSMPKFGCLGQAPIHCLFKSRLGRLGLLFRGHGRSCSHSLLIGVCRDAHPVFTSKNL